MKSFGLLLLALGLVCVFAETPNSITLVATIRDFTPTLNSDFELDAGSETGAIESTLDANEKPVLKPGSHSAFTGQANFAQWYTISDPGRVTTFNLVANKQADGSYLYNNQNYFPINGQLLGNYANTGRNFHFTSEIKTSFSYVPGATFNFQGDDDVFVFLGDGTTTKLVIDLGGIHGAQSASFNLDTVSVPWTWDANKAYTMWIFHAERHTTQSTFKFTTTIQFKPAVPAVTLTCPFLEVRDPDYSCNANTFTEGPSDGQVSVKPSQIDVLIEGLFSVATGDTEGRVGSGLFQIGAGYSIGYVLNTSSTQDGHAPYGLFAVSGNPENGWISGELFPVGEEAIYSGGAALSSSTANNLQDRIALDSSSSLYTASSLASDFAAYFSCVKSYTTNKFGASQTATAHYESQWSGLHIWCDASTTGKIVLKIPADVLSASQWYQVDYASTGCDQTADWLILVSAGEETSVAVLQGDQFPALPGHVTYYFDNSITEVHVQTGVAGSIVAPFSHITQDGGVVIGKVIGKSFNATGASQINRPCGSETVQLKTVVAGSSGGKRSGNTVVEVDGFGGLIAGDTVTIDGSKTAIISALITKDGKYYIVFDRVVTGIKAGSEITTTADFTIYRVNDVSDVSDLNNSGSSVIAPFACLLLALLVLVF